MEQNNITLQYGIHRTPSLGADGELSECVNLIPQNGELVNIQECEKISAPEHFPIDSYSWNEKYSHDVVTSDWTEHVISEESNYFTYTMSSISLVGGKKYKLVVDIEEIPEQDSYFEHFIKITLDGKEYTNYATTTGNVVRFSGNHLEIAFTQPTNSTASLVIRDESDMPITAIDLPAISFSIYEYELDDNAVAIDYIDVPNGYELVYIHEHGEIKNHIFRKDNAIYWVTDDMLTLIHDFREDNGVISISSVGLVLVVSTNNGMRYIRYIKNEGYRYLGKLPDLSGFYPCLSSGIAMLYDGQKESVNCSETSDSFASMYSNFHGNSAPKKDFIFNETDDCTTKISNLLSGCINVLRKSIHREGLFCFPFYVKIALRLYDGSNVSITRPFLMRPTDKGTPFIVGSCQDETNRILLFPFMIKSQLLLHTEQLSTDWEDIITAVDIYVTPEILDYTDGANKSLAKAVPYSEGAESGYVYENYSGEMLPLNLSIEGDQKFFLLIKEQKYTRDLHVRPRTKQHTFHFSSYKYIATLKTEVTGFGDNDITKVDTSSDVYTQYITTVPNYSDYDWWTSTKKDKFKSRIWVIDGVTNFTLRFYNLSDLSDIAKDFYIEMERADGLNYSEALDVNEYFLLDSVPFSELQNIDGIYTPDTEGKIVEAIETRTRLKEEQVNVDDVVSNAMFPYNKRLSVVTNKKKFKGLGGLETLKDRGVLDFEDIEIPEIEVTTEEYRAEHPYSPSSKIFNMYVHIKNGGFYSAKPDRRGFYSDRLSFISYGGSNADKVYVDQAFDLPINHQYITIDIYKDEQVIASGSTYGMKIYSESKFYAGYIIEYPLKISASGNFSYSYQEGLALDSSNNWKYIRWEHLNTFQSVRAYISHYAEALGLDVSDADIDYSTNIALSACRDIAQTAIRDYMDDQTIMVDEQSGYLVNEVPFDFDQVDEFQEEHGLVYQSKVDNPFLFVNSHTCQIGCNEVFRLSTAAKALSQGQFSQFPLYAFCDNGIWPIAINDEGAQVAVEQSISRDVLTNIGSVTQIDNAVVFVTNQGLKLIQGSEVVLLSEAVEGLNLNESFIEDAVDIFADKFSMTSPFVEDDSQFVQQVQTAKIVYDYPHNLLHIFFEDTDDEATMHIHYVYDFVSKQWSKQALPYQLKAVVPGYPLTTMQFDNALYQYDKTADNTMRIGYALTRPLALGNPLARKALYDLRVVGQKTSQNSLRRVAVWVSNDNINWHRLTSLKALSAKYYRFLIMTHHNDIDTVSGLALQYDERYNHKMRGH